MTIQKLIINVFLLIPFLASTGCVSDIRAQKYNKEDDCWGPREDVGNDWGPTGCDQGTGITVDANGDYWRFPNMCLADGYETIENNRLRSELLSADNCFE